MARCAICAIEADFKDVGGFLCAKHWRLVPKAKEDAYRLACTAFRVICSEIDDPEHPKRDKAHRKAVGLFVDCRAMAKKAAS